MVEAIAPLVRNNDPARGIIGAVAVADWAPIKLAGQLHDHASHRADWQDIGRACQVWRARPDTIQPCFLIH